MVNFKLYFSDPIINNHGGVQYVLRDQDISTEDDSLNCVVSVCSGFLEDKRVVCPCCKVEHKPRFVSLYREVLIFKEGIATQPGVP